MSIYILQDMMRNQWRQIHSASRFRSITGLQSTDASPSGGNIGLRKQSSTGRHIDKFVSV